jgi:enoyl-CoA hydratase
MDLRAMAGDADEEGAIDTSQQLTEDPDFIYRGLLKTYQPTKPVVLAVEGTAIAGGTEMLQGTDIRVAGESARFGVSEVRWSLYPMGGSAVRLRRQIPYTEAADILLTGRHITAPEAKALGLVGHVVPDGQALDKAMEIARTIAANGPLAVEAVLRTLRETEHLSEAEAFAHEAGYGLAVFGSQDAKEGPKAFAEKRTPNFQRK